MADSRAATGTSFTAAGAGTGLNDALAAEGILYDGSTDGFVDTMNHAQIKNLIRIVETQGLQLAMSSSGVLTIKQGAGLALTDTSTN